MSEQNFQDYEVEVQRSSSDFWFACVDICVLRDAKLSKTARLIYAIICSYASFSNRTCWPTVKTLADDAGVSPSTVQRMLDELTEKKLITRRARFVDRRQVSSMISLIGFHSERYTPEDTPEGGVAPVRGEGSTHDTRGVAPMTDRTIPKNDIKDTLTGGDRLPENSREKTHEQKPSESAVSIQTGLSQNPKECCTPDDAPSLFRPTAKYFLHETGRSGLTREDISALRKLAVNHTPARIQGEIDTACKRFRRRGQALTALTFEYIAKSLEHQQSYKERKNKTPDATKGGITSADIENRTAKTVTAEENELIEAEIREGRLL